MKKLLNVLVVLGLVAGSAQALDNKGMSSMQIGVNNVDITGAHTGVYLGYDFMTHTSKGYPFSFGLGFDMGSFSFADGNINYNLGAMVKVGFNAYDYIHYPLKVKVGVGYGDTYLNPLNYGGMQYAASIALPIYKSLELGAQYKRTSLNVDNLSSYEQTSVYIDFSF